VKQLVGNVLFGFDDEVSQWVAERIPGFVPSISARALGVVSGTELVAGIVYERWNGIHVEASIAIDDPGWAKKNTLFRIFHYPFNQLGCEAISVLVPTSNLKSLNLASKLGFEPEAIVKFAAHDGSDLLVLKMFKENCRWIGNHGQGKQQARST
jgi:RimJ/RimL family protein N-acetyltransferase